MNDPGHIRISRSSLRCVNLGIGPTPEQIAGRTGSSTQVGFSLTTFAHFVIGRHTIYACIVLPARRGQNGNAPAEKRKYIRGSPYWRVGRAAATVVLSCGTEMVYKPASIWYSRENFRHLSGQPNEHR
jgi:hypothetical protein